MSKHKVVILGGGVAGMSAAHELIERGFTVCVYEKQSLYVGGKARSIDYYGNKNQPYQLPLPGEHGFRFFPGFYKHITNTMERTPATGTKSCVDNLVYSETAMMASFDKTPFLTLVNFPKSFKDLELILIDFVKMPTVTGLTIADGKFFAQKLWQLMTSSFERRAEEYEHISWWEYTEAASRSKAYQQYFVSGLTRTLVAAKSEEVSTKTGGNILLQLLFLMADPNAHADRVLNSPTNEAWLYPWRDYLIEQGVNYNHGCETIALDCNNGKITAATIRKEDGSEEKLDADFFISALPVERMAPLLTPDIIQSAPKLALLKPLAKDVSWMTGIQFYLNKNIKLNKGHTIYTDSPWALTSVSQIQFWENYDITKRGNGEVLGILSVDISDWFTPGLNGKKAADCNTKEEVKEEVWNELKKSLNIGKKTILSDDMLVDYYLDRDIVFPEANSNEMKTRNEEPLLVNKINTWALRPEAQTEIPNLLLASDYVRTYTDLATMEGANEAARRAVNSILSATNHNSSPCKIWKLEEPELFRVYRWYDKMAFRKGKAWSGNDLPFPYDAINFWNVVWLAFRTIF